MIVLSTVMAGCGKSGGTDDFSVKNPITIESPVPEVYIPEVSLSDEQLGMVAGENSFAINGLKALYGQEKGSFVYSPLSLQYALAMVMNGAVGETAGEIADVMGLGDDIDAVNDFCNLLLKQLPALDRNITIKLSDAVVANRSHTLRDFYVSRINSMYYAPVEYVDEYKKEEVIDRINEWAHRNTNGTISPFLSENDLDDYFVLSILNSLYFKAPWRSMDYKNPMFDSDGTQKGQTFYFDGGKEGTADYMVASHNYRYGRLGGSGIVEIPYSDNKFAMYVVLPDEKGGNGLETAISSLQADTWSEAISSMSSDYQINLRLPKFESESKYNLVEMLKSLGIKKAFDKNMADFSDMFKTAGDDVCIEKIIQKTRICVSEWGSEAGSATMIEMSLTSPGDSRKLDFIADHPFIYVIAEKSSGTMLFAGVYNGE